MTRLTRERDSTETGSASIEVDAELEVGRLQRSLATEVFRRSEAPAFAFRHETIREDLAHLDAIDRARGAVAGHHACALDSIVDPYTFARGTRMRCARGAPAICVTVTSQGEDNPILGTT